MSGQQQFPQRAKNAVDNKKLNLTAFWGEPSKKASLVWSLVSNNPRIIVYTNEPDVPSEKAKINANLDLPVFFTFLEVLNRIIEGPNDKQEIIRNKNFIFPGGKRSEKPVVVSELHCGKDSDGVVWMGLVAKDSPKIRFPFAVSDFHQFMHADGTPYSKAENSVVAARGYMKLLQLLMTQVAVDTYVEPPPRDQQQRGGGQGGGGNWNRGGSGGGNYSGSGGGRSGGGGDDLGDDMPF